MFYNNIFALLLLLMYVLLIMTESVSSQEEVIPYIYDGTNAKRGEYPAIVSLKIIKHSKVYMCSGTLIDKSHVVTAGHCVINVPPYQVGIQQ